MRSDFLLRNFQLYFSLQTLFIHNLRIIFLVHHERYALYFVISTFKSLNIVFYQ